MSTTHGVEDTLKDFWATRPRRPRRGRKVAGVAAGIGNRYAIDPVVVRVGFVVAAFYGGAGVLFYLLGWLFLPEQDDEAAPLESMVNRKRSSTSTAFTVLLCLALAPALYFFVDNQFSGILGLLVVAGIVFLLHRTRGHLNRPAATAPVSEPTVATAEGAAATWPYTAPATGDPAASASAASASAGASASPSPSASASAEPGPPQPTPPAWDPLGAAPFAWDLPEPSPPAPEPPQPRGRSRIGLVTVGVALVVAGALALIAPYAGGWLSPTHIIGITLGVIGLGMVGGAFLGSGRGLIGLAVPLSVIGIGITVVAPDGWHGVGDLTARPTSVEEVQSDYRRSAGRVTLDLTALPDTDETVDTSVDVDTGEVVVIVPRTADVEVQCTASAGDVNCLGRTADGFDAEQMVHEDGPGNLKIELDAEVGAGDVEVRRG